MESHNLSGLFADRYTIERTLGRGASATVYLAHDNKQDREIALKVLDHELAHAIGAKRFLQEIHITSRLQHPHILPIHDSGEWNGLLYYILPFVAGESLRERLEREKQLPIDECVQLTCDVASALAHAHSKGVIHRDIKPENIMLSEGHALVADFGIARTIDIHTGERLTSSGLIVGTSQYMSPEQASGEREIDARSDIYSLGCVLYEMLAGIEPFVGPNVQAIMAQRFTHAPRPVITFRPTVPDYLDAALKKALAISPADRFRTMQEFAAALPSSGTSSGERRRSGRALRDLLRTRRGRLAFTAATLIAVALAAAGLSGRGLRIPFATQAPLDTSLYVVLPFLDETGSVTPRSREFSGSVYRAMNQWDSLPVVSDKTIDDALSRSGDPKIISEALERARDVGAGRLIWGTTGSNGILQLFDVQAGTRIREVDYSGADVRAESTLVALLRDPAWPRRADGALGKTKSFTAWQAYGRAHAYLKRWNLRQALAQFDRSAASDNEFASARLWGAQLRSWIEEQTPSDSIAWRRAATFAAAQSSRLSSDETILARALSAIAARDYAVACSEYRKLVAADSMEFIAWHGLGRCERLDETVVKSRTSPSGWAFRSSYADAAKSFMRAAQLEPRAHSIVTFDAMQTLLITSTTKIRAGTDPATGTRFAAYPSIDFDTLAFVPYPLKAFATLTTSRHDALDRNARDLLAFTTSWTESEPGNPVAWEALASVLETMGSISVRNPAATNASTAIARALKLATDPKARVRLSTREVRIRIKRGEFAAASGLADSVLSNTPDSISSDLLALAAFTGRTGSMIRLAQLHKGWMPIGVSQYTLMPDLVATSAEFFARAALGECGENMSALEKTFDNQLASYVSPDKHAAVRHILMARAYSLLTPCTNGASALKITSPENQLYRLQQSYAQKNQPVLRARIDSMSRLRADSRPGDRPADFTYQEAWIMTAVGDTSGAIRKLDLGLGAIPSMSAATLAQPAAAAAIGRMIALRADIAAKIGDRENAVRWGKAGSELWRNADKSLSPTIGRMKTLAAGQ